MTELLMLWLATAALCGSVVAYLFAAIQLHADDDDSSNVIVLPPRAQRSGPTHVVCHEAPRPAFFDQDAIA